MELTQKIAIVTGASSGLGAAFARGLVAKGTTVYGLARNVEKLNAIQNKLGNTFIPVSMDITDQKALNVWVKNTFSDSHIPNILINNAGAGYFRKIDELPLEQWHAMVNTNLNGTFYLSSSIVSNNEAKSEYLPHYQHRFYIGKNNKVGKCCLLCH